MRRYARNPANPRGHRQAGASKKALEIRSTSNHGHVVKKEEPLAVPVRIHPQEALRRLEGLSGSLERYTIPVYTPQRDEPPTFLIPPELARYIGNGHKPECHVP